MITNNDKANSDNKVIKKQSSPVNSDKTQKKIYLNRQEDIKDYILNEENLSILSSSIENNTNTSTCVSSSCYKTKSPTIYSSYSTNKSSVFEYVKEEPKSFIIPFIKIFMLVMFIVYCLIAILVVDDVSYDIENDNNNNIFYSKITCYIFSGVSLGLILSICMFNLKNYIKPSLIDFISNVIKSLLFFFSLIMLFRHFNSTESYFLYKMSKSLDLSILFIIIFIVFFISSLIPFFLISNIIIYFIIGFTILSILSSLQTYYYSSYKGFDWCIYLFICLLAVFVTSGIYFEYNN